MSETKHLPPLSSHPSCPAPEEGRFILAHARRKASVHCGGEARWLEMLHRWQQEHEADAGHVTYWQTLKGQPPSDLVLPARPHFLIPQPSKNALG